MTRRSDTLLLQQQRGRNRDHGEALSTKGHQVQQDHVTWQGCPLLGDRRQAQGSCLRQASEVARTRGVHTAGNRHHRDDHLHRLGRLLSRPRPNVRGSPQHRPGGMGSDLFSLVCHGDRATGPVPLVERNRNDLSCCLSGIRCDCRVWPRAMARPKPQVNMAARYEADNLVLGWRVSLAINAENEDPKDRTRTNTVPRQYATVRARAMQATGQRI